MSASVKDEILNLFGCELLPQRNRFISPFLTSVRREQIFFLKCDRKPREEFLTALSLFGLAEIAMDALAT